MIYDERCCGATGASTFQQFLENFASRYHVERWRYGIAIFEVAHPQVASGEFPFCVRSFLETI